MNWVSDILSNHVFWASISGWLIAQILKVIYILITEKNFRLSLILSSGGMPSSHSSLVCACTTSVGKYFGLASPLFSIAAVFSFIVMYDAANVRLETGKQAQILNDLAASQSIERFGKELKELIGHTPLQVIAGAGCGIIIGMLL